MRRTLRVPFIASIALSSLLFRQVQLEFLSSAVSYTAVLPLRTGGRLAVGSTLTGVAGCATCTHRQLRLDIGTVDLGDRHGALKTACLRGSTVVSIA